MYISGFLFHLRYFGQDKPKNIRKMSPNRWRAMLLWNKHRELEGCDEYEKINGEKFCEEDYE